MLRLPPPPLLLTTLVLLSTIGGAGATVPMYNSVPGSAAATTDAHDGPVVQWEDGGMFYRYAMSYTSCRLDGDAGTWTAVRPGSSLTAAAAALQCRCRRLSPCLALTDSC